MSIDIHNPERRIKVICCSFCELRGTTVPISDELATAFSLACDAGVDAEVAMGPVYSEYKRALDKFDTEHAGKHDRKVAITILDFPANRYEELAKA